MKVTHLIAAGLVMAGLGVSTAASAQDYRHDHRHGWNNHRHCHTEYRHHHRVQVCR